MSKKSSILWVVGLIILTILISFLSKKKDIPLDYPTFQTKKPMEVPLIKDMCVEFPSLKGCIKG